MNFYRIIFCLFLSITINSYGQRNQAINQDFLSTKVKVQAYKMGQFFLNGDYKTFTKYTYPKLVEMMGGPNKMEEILAKTITNMKANGMTFNNIIFGEPSKIVKNGNELQCTILQRTEIKLTNGKIITTSTLIALSSDDGINWSFVDTSDKDVNTIKKLLPNLSSTITIPPQQSPVRYGN